MANLLQQAGASSEPTSFAPLHTNRIFTGLWTNRNVLRDAATSDYQEKYGMSRQDSILGGFNSEISSRLTLVRRSGNSVYNGNTVPPVNRFYSFITQGSNGVSSIRVIADTTNAIYDVTAPNVTLLKTKDPFGSGPAFFLGVGNTLYWSEGFTQWQWFFPNGQIYPWGIAREQVIQILSVTPTAPPATATLNVQYGYAFRNSITNDISNMSNASAIVAVADGYQVQIQGRTTTQLGADKIVIYRTAQGGSTFFQRDEIDMPTGTIFFQYTDTIDDTELNIFLQAQRQGEGTPLAGLITCLGYHVGRIFAAKNNVVCVSSGPDAIVSGSSGNAGFDTFFTAQSPITRFWPCSLGMVVFTVRDAYIILGSGTDADPLYMVTFIEQLPLLHFDAFTVNKTTPMLMMGNNMVVALDPSAGIVEVGFPIADRFEEEFNPALAYVTYHSQSSRESALYVANGSGYWYRMNQNNAPEQGSAWSPRANIAGMGCVQSVEITPGIFRLLWSGTAPGPIMMRDVNARTDNGVAYPAETDFGSIVMAQPGQLAAISFITLESRRVGTRAGLALLLGEISGDFEELKRTRQDPTNLPPSTTLFSDRYHFAQNQNTAWCRHFQMRISWPAEDAANELLTFTIFGQTWQEMRSQ